MGYIGPLVMIGFLALHLYMTKDIWREEAIIAVVATLVGIAVDNSLHLVGAVSYVGELTVGYSPAWLVAIWLGFGPTLRHSQSLFVRRWLNTLLVGFIGGPLAYYGGVKLARLSVNGLHGWLSVSVAWALAMSALYLVIRKIGDQRG
jgi:hypothetical protein